MSVVPSFLVDTHAAFVREADLPGQLAVTFGTFYKSQQYVLQSSKSLILRLLYSLERAVVNIIAPLIIDKVRGPIRSEKKVNTGLDVTRIITIKNCVRTQYLKH